MAAVAYKQLRSAAGCVQLQAGNRNRTACTWCPRRPAPHLHKSARLLLVVDFANSAGSLRESFEEFWGATRLHLGRRAKRIRLELRMDHAVSRILELLQPAAARAFPSVAGGLAALSVRQVGWRVTRWAGRRGRRNAGGGSRMKKCE